MVTSVCVAETMIGSAAAAPSTSATTAATTLKLSDVDLRNAGGVPLDGVRSPHRVRAEVAVGGSPVSSGEAAPQIESPQNRHLDLLVLRQLSPKIFHLSKLPGLQQKHGQTTPILPTVLAGQQPVEGTRE
jgi:hypothetical protein